MAKLELLQPGTRCGYVTVIGMVGTYIGQETPYRVRKTCCGTECELTHKELLVIRHKGRRRCKACNYAHREGKPRNRIAWTEAEDAIVYALYPAHDLEIQAALLQAGYERTVRSIQQHRIYTLGLSDQDDDVPEASGAMRTIDTIEIPAPKTDWVPAMGHWWPPLGRLGPRGV